MKMGKVSISLSNELEEELRIEAMKEFGMKKGYLSKAVTKALESWFYMSEESKKYLEKLRREIPTEEAPSLKRTTDLALQFIREKEEEFIDWVKEILKV